MGHLTSQKSTYHSPSKLFKSRIDIAIRAILLAAVFFTASPAEVTPTAAWEKALPSDCYFVANAGDSIICVGTSIFVLSKDGALLSQSSPLDDTRNISDNMPVFYLTNDKSIVMIVDFCTVKKISLGGETVWGKRFCDSIPGMSIKGFTEDADGNAYLCGSVGNHSGLIVKREIDGTFTNKADSSSTCLFSIVCFGDTLFATSSDSATQASPGSLKKYDNKGNFIGRIIDTGCGSHVLIDEGHIVTISMKGNAILAKRAFFATSDILLKKYSMNGIVDTVVMFDFGKLEMPISAQRYQDGLLMIIESNETTKFGTNIMNYYITKLDASFKKQWQLHFGTDTGYANIRQRYFFVDNRGTILSAHKDTLFKYTDESIGVRRNFHIKPANNRAPLDKTVRMFDLHGRKLFEYRSGAGLSDHVIRPIGKASGLHVRQSGSGFESGTKAFYLKQ